MTAACPESSAPLVVHVIHHLGVGGLENGLVNLINRMAHDRYRHAIVCMTGFSEFRHRIAREDVFVYAMHRGNVPLARIYFDLFRLFRRLRPAIVHSRNRSGLDALMPAICAGVPVRIHGEHGRDMDDLDGSNPKYRRLKRAFRPFVTAYTAVSRDLAQYLEVAIGVPAGRVHQIYNGVDTDLFHPDPAADGASAAERRPFVVGTVGRLQPVKNQVMLLKAFAAAIERAPRIMDGARLILAGEGPARPAIEGAIAKASLHSRVELLGSKDDVPNLLRQMDVFVLPSLAEGISNTVLEAMATGIPVIATRVGGNAELVEHGRTGALVESDDWNAVTEHLIAYASDSNRRSWHGQAARQRAERDFSLDTMVRGYAELYDRLTGSRNHSAAGTVLRSMSRG